MSGLLKTTLLGLAFSLGASATLSADYYVDPVSGAPENDGSAKSPWRSLETVIDEGRLKAGDTLYLRDGFHGALKISGRQNNDWITITAEEGHEPKLSLVAIRDSRFWRVSGLDVSPEYGGERPEKSIVSIGRDTSDIVFSDSKVRTVLDASGWSAEDWKTYALNGIGHGGERVSVTDNLVQNVRHGMPGISHNSRIAGNTIDNYSADGMRGLGNHTVYEFNRITNCRDVDGNHDDGFQSWSIGPDKKPGTGTVVGGVLRGNVIIGVTDPDQPFACRLQGIGMFDGMFEDWVIENNLILVDHYHGITVMGAKNVVVRNNTVMKWGNGSGRPWVVVTRHKDGRLAENSVVANNLLPEQKWISQDQFRLRQPGVAIINNMEVKKPEKFYVDPKAFDLRLRDGSPAADLAAPQFAPPQDVDGVDRSKGRGPDIGAYESW